MYATKKLPNKKTAETYNLFRRAERAGINATAGVDVSWYPCGFAWVNIKPGTSRFARQLKELGLAYSDSYYGGVTIWIGGYDQIMTLKEMHAEAMAKVLRAEGINAVAMSRMD